MLIYVAIGQEKSNFEVTTRPIQPLSFNSHSR